MGYLLDIVTRLTQTQYRIPARDLVPMQVTGLYLRHPFPPFVDRTPRVEEIALNPSQLNLSMPNPTVVAIGAGPLYTNAIMGQAPSAVERENARQASSTIHREDSVRIEETENISRPEPWSTHWACTNQAPYSAQKDNKMMTQNSLLRVHKHNASHDLAFFLRTTGPTAPHRWPSKIEGPWRTVSSPKNALRMLKNRRKRPLPDFQDEGGLLEENPEPTIPKGVEQKFSLTGKRYLALIVPSSETQELGWDDIAVLSPAIVESRVSVYFGDSNGPEVETDDWRSYAVRNAQVGEKATTDNTNSTGRFVSDGEWHWEYLPSRTRPFSSNSSTPEPLSVMSIAESYRSDLSDHPAARSFDTLDTLSSHPVQAKMSSRSLIYDISSPVSSPNRETGLDIQQPSPRRFASHPVLLQRGPSLASSLHPRSLSDSPGPPPRNPSRLRRDPRAADSVLASYAERKATPKAVPSLQDVSKFNNEVNTIKATVITECTGPIKRPKSRDSSPTRNSVRQAAVREREGRTHARKLRDRPIATPTIDAVVNAPPTVPRQRLKKARPHVQIPDLVPAPLATRAPSSASSIASGQKITEYTCPPFPGMLIVDTSTVVSEKTGYTPISATVSNDIARESNLAISPVTLVAEQIPLPGVKSPPKGAKLLVKDGKAYNPRPRSASISRGARRRHSRQGIRTPPPPNIPTDDTPPLPLPPPNRALPPTPPVSGSEKPSKLKTIPAAETGKELPSLPPRDTPPKANTARRVGKVPHIATQQRDILTDLCGTSDIYTRLAAAEKQNALLEAALEAVLRTNGTLNAPLKNSLVWESRIARRSAASHAASSSNGSALDLYLNTRQGSRRWC